MTNCRFDLTFIILGVTNLSTIKPTNFVEIGSRDGYDTCFIADHFNINHKNCVVFEPHPNSCRQIMEKYPNFNTFNNAISSNTGIKNFYIDDDGGNAGICGLLKNKTASQKIIQIECIDMKSVIENLKLKLIDICKIDVEGSVLDVLQSFGSDINLVKSIQLECETIPSWENQSLYPEVKSFLEKNNFIEVLFCRLHDGQIDDFWIQKPFLK